MLTIQQKDAINNFDKYIPKTKRVIRKRILDRMDRAIDDMVLTFDNADKFPDLKNRIPPDKMEKLVDCYFNVFKVDLGFSDPKKVIKILGENAALKRENALLTQELGTMVHRVEHFKYLTTHVTSLLEKERQENDIMP
jgi:hypothetical protein